jgi:hypothetical protein
MNNMLKVWIVSGILVGLVMGAFGIVYYGDPWLMVLLVGGMSGIVFGFCLGVIANVLTRSGQSGCICAFLLMLAGFILGPVLFFAVDQLPHGQWSQHLSPPEKAVRFVGQSAFNFWGDRSTLKQKVETTIHIPVTPKTHASGLKKKLPQVSQKRICGVVNLDIYGRWQHLLFGLEQL